MVYGHEIAPTSGTPHLQGFFHLKNAKYFNSLIRKLPKSIHIEPARESAATNRGYCTKDDDFFERGIIPIQGKRNDIESFNTQIKDRLPTTEELLNLPLYMRYPRHVEKCIEYFHPPKNLDALDNLWIMGPTGSGKSTKARELHSEVYSKRPTKWFCNYVRETPVLIEDIDPTHSYLGHDLKIWADHYPFRAETKGGSMLIRPPNIVVTSNYHPRDIWPDPNMHDPILRRFKILHVTTFKKA